MIYIKHLQRRWLFVTLDFVGVILMFFLAMYLRASVKLPIFRDVLMIQTLFPWYVLLIHTFAFGLCYIAIQYLFGKYDLWASASGLIWLKRLLLPNLFLLALIFSYLYLSQRFNFPRSFIVTFCLLNVLFGLSWRLFYFHYLDSTVTKVLLVGGLKQLLPLAKEFDFPPFVGRIQVGAIFTDTAEQENIKNYEIFPISEFKNYAKNHFYDSVIIDPSELNSATILKDLVQNADQKTSLYVLPSIFEILLGRLNHVQVNDLPLLELKLKSVSPIFTLFKRVFDLFFSFLFLLLLAIPSAAIALIIKLTSKGSVFYSQIRVGLNGKLFRIYKFRSMIRDAERYTGAVLATKHDKRITKFGRFLRKTRLDEIPQLFNILRGDMSFVGPRPERPRFVKRFEREIPGYKERKRIRPGITGLAQVSGSYETSADIKLKYDLAYLVNQSLLLDIQILLRTLKTLLAKAGQ